VEVNGTEWTKRDDLAALFLQGMLSENPIGPGQEGVRQAALMAYRYADGFLAARAELLSLTKPG
jgi:hypothetical protein